MNDKSDKPTGPRRGGSRNADKGAAGSPAKKRTRSRSRGRTKKVDPQKYWGEVELLPEWDEHVISTPDPSTVVNSLGRPPIPGHENASKHYFSLVYDRAAALAVALAAAGGLTDYAATASSGNGGSGEADETGRSRDGEAAERDVDGVTA